jgi:hypothetical protein
LLSPAERNGAAVGEHLQRSEEAVLEHFRADRSSSIATR